MKYLKLIGLLTFGYMRAHATQPLTFYAIEPGYEKEISQALIEKEVKFRIIENHEEKLSFINIYQDANCLEKTQDIDEIFNFFKSRGLIEQVTARDSVLCGSSCGTK